jgi:hypothetical protein
MRIKMNLNRIISNADLSEREKKNLSINYQFIIFSGVWCLNIDLF